MGAPDRTSPPSFVTPVLGPTYFYEDNSSSKEEERNSSMPTSVIPGSNDNLEACVKKQM